MRNWFFIWGMFLLGICEAQAQAFAIFPYERKEALWDSVLYKYGVASSVTYKVQSSDMNKVDSLHVGTSFRNNSAVREGVGFVGPRLYRYGALNGSLFERSQGGDNSHLWALQWASDSLYLDSGALIPLILVDFYGTDTLKNLLWCVSEADSELLELNWADEALSDLVWRNIAWEERWLKGDSFAYFVIDDYLLQLPCSHETVYLHYAGSKDITLTIDYDFAGGLTLEECLPFIEEHVEHLRAFHHEDCRTDTPQLTIEVAVRNAAIVEIREFMRKISDLGIRIELVFPWER